MHGAAVSAYLDMYPSALFCGAAEETFEEDFVEEDASVGGSGRALRGLGATESSGAAPSESSVGDDGSAVSAAELVFDECFYDGMVMDEVVLHLEAVGFDVMQFHSFM